MYAQKTVLDWANTFDAHPIPIRIVARLVRRNRDNERDRIGFFPQKGDLKMVPPRGR
jgi:hypothetical protein